MMRKIAVEEHFTTQAYQAYLAKVTASGGFSSLGKLPPQLDAKMLDLGKSRLLEMGESGIDMQVLSLTVPGLERVPAADAVELARDINDELADAMQRNPAHFAGFAALPTLDPQAASAELARAVQKLGLKGAMINGQPQEGFLDDSVYWDIFAQAEALNVPLYLHPSAPTPGTLQAYAGRPELVGPLWRFTVDIATQALRLIFSGVFDRFPKLTIMLGHMGETLPYMLWRLDSRWKFSPLHRHLEREPSQYIRENMLVTTSGMFSDTALLCAIAALGVERILFAVDYPFEPNNAGAVFIEQVPLAEADREKIASLNAERWLRL
jgi:2,3-dihydroxybenzoate decarboxylase